MDIEPSFEQVVAMYTQTVYGIALTHTARRADADDVFQEVFHAYWRSQPQLSGEEHRKAWLIRTTLNHCLKLTQSSWAKRTVSLDSEGGSTSPANADRSAMFEHTGSTEQHSILGITELPSADFPFQSQQQTALYAAMRSLPTAYRTVVLLFYFEDLPIAQIASTLGEAEGTIKTRLSRARVRLRERLKEGAEDD